MKTNLRNKTMFALLMAFGIITGVVAAGSVTETTVFSDNFNRVDISPGSPEVTHNDSYRYGCADYTRRRLIKITQCEW